MARHSDDLVDESIRQLTTLAGMPADDPDRRPLRGRVIEGLVPLADRLAHRYAHRGERADDLAQVARVGLVKAVDGYDPSRGGFLGYAVPTIRGELKRYFRDQCWDLRVPRHLQELRLSVAATAERLEQTVGHEPTDTELADELSVERSEVAAARDAGSAYRVASLDVETSTDGGPGTVADLIGGPSPRLEQVPDRVSLGPALARLPDRERQVLAMRFVDGMTQSQIAEGIGLSQMHVSRLLRRTLAGLRAWLEGESSEVDVCHPRAAA